MLWKKYYRYYCYYYLNALKVIRSVWYWQPHLTFVYSIRAVQKCFKRFKKILKCRRRNVAELLNCLFTLVSSLLTKNNVTKWIRCQPLYNWILLAHDEWFKLLTCAFQSFSKVAISGELFIMILLETIVIRNGVNMLHCATFEQIYYALFNWIIFSTYSNRI